MELVHAQKEQFEYKDIVFLEQSNAGVGGSIGLWLS